MMGKLQSIRNTYTAASGAETAPVASAEEPNQALRKSASSLSSSSLAATEAAPDTAGASVETEADVTDVRASQSVLSLQERLARLRA